MLERSIVMKAVVLEKTCDADEREVSEVEIPEIITVNFQLLLSEKNLS